MNLSEPWTILFIRSTIAELNRTIVEKSELIMRQRDEMTSNPMKTKNAGHGISILKSDGPVKWRAKRNYENNEGDYLSRF